MPKTVLITLTTAGPDTGPFDLYCVDSLGNIIGPPFENNVSKAALVAGYVSVLVPDACNIIRVQSDNQLCTNFIDLVLPITTTTTTTSSSTTSTTSTTTTTTLNLTTSTSSTTTTTTGQPSSTTTTTTGQPGTTTTTTSQGSGTTTTTTQGAGTTTTTTAQGTTTTTTAGGGGTTTTTTIGTTTTTTACVDSCLRIVNPDNTLVAYTLNSCFGLPIPTLIDGLQTEYRCGTNIVDPGGTLVVTNLGNCSVCDQFTTTSSTTTTTTLNPSDCFCWTVTNISTATIDYSYLPCGSVDPVTVSLAGPGTEYVCSSVSPLTADPFNIIISGGTTPCTENNNCVP